MEHIFQSDIFFFITSIFVIVLTVVLAIGGVYLIKILKNFSDMSKTLKKTVTDTSSELAGMAKDIRTSKLFTFIFGKSRNRKHDKSTTS